ncbi:MAG: hypothetical protein FD130_21 [Halothiobacillaceae bacterium]|nr:MAG: hypothetical protein FD130_21 [Halothiobacillaceae bacterium]
MFVLDELLPPPVTFSKNNVPRVKVNDEAKAIASLLFPPTPPTQFINVQLLLILFPFIVIVVAALVTTPRFVPPLPDPPTPVNIARFNPEPLAVPRVN